MSVALLGARVVDNRFSSAIFAVLCQSSLTAVHIDVTDSTRLKPSMTLVVIIIDCNSSPFIVVLEGFLAFTPYFQLGTISILYFNQHSCTLIVI